MPFNRIDGFYVGNYSGLEKHFMSIDAENSEVNRVLESRLNQLNSAIDAHEKALKKMMIPRDVGFVYQSESIEDDQGRCVGETRYQIGMIKWQGSWRLCHGIDVNFGPDETVWKPLVDASIPDRLRATPHLDKLRSKIIEEKKRIIPELESAIDELARSLREFEQPNSQTQN